MEIAACGDQRSKAVLRQLLELDAAGQRFAELLMLVDDRARERRIGEKSLPFIRQIRREIGDGRTSKREAVS